MILPDVNVLIYAHREDAPEHERYAGWLQGLTASDEPFGLSDVVLAGFLRIVTHPKIFSVPSAFEEAVGFLQTIHESGLFQEAPWTPRVRARWQHWCRELGLHGNDVNDAYIAAIAAEARCRLVTRDGGFSRFPGLDWWNPVK